MKKKTPLQQLINDWEDFCNKEANHLFNAIASAFINEAKKMLEEEKEQLIQAVYRGDEGESFYGSANDLESFINARQDAEEWFERTYESNA